MQTAASGAPSAASGPELIFVASIIGGVVAALLAVAVLASSRPRFAGNPRGLDAPGQEEPSAYVSAVFVGTRRLPVIEAVARQKRRVAWTTETARVLVGCAIAVLVAFLIVQFVI